jgi:hypothetical protein
VPTYLQKSRHSMAKSTPPAEIPITDTRKFPPPSGTRDHWNHSRIGIVTKAPIIPYVRKLSSILSLSPQRVPATSRRTVLLLALLVKGLSKGRWAHFCVCRTTISGWVLYWKLVPFRYVRCAGLHSMRPRGTPRRPPIGFHLIPPDQSFFSHADARVHIQFSLVRTIIDWYIGQRPWPTPQLAVTFCTFVRKFSIILEIGHRDLQPRTRLS